MKKLIIGIVIVIALAVAWYLVSPLWRNIKIDEDSPLVHNPKIDDSLEVMDATSASEFKK